MAHSHLPVKHLIRQVEQRRTLRMRRDARPAWVSRFVDRVADSFEPVADVGRVGFLCQPVDDGWTVTMYLGRTEIVGGREDGVIRPASFHFDIHAAIGCFTEIHSIRWTACADAPSEADGDDCSLLRIEGSIEGKPLRLIVPSVPPDVAGPGLRQYPDGRCAPA